MNSEQAAVEVILSLRQALDHVSRAVTAAQTSEIPGDRWAQVARAYQDLHRKMGELELVVNGFSQ